MPSMHGMCIVVAGQQQQPWYGSWSTEAQRVTADDKAMSHCLRRHDILVIAADRFLGDNGDIWCQTQRPHVFWC